jgi:hypothetical protein
MSGKMVDDMEIARLQELLRSGELLLLERVFTQGEKRLL